MDFATLKTNVTTWVTNNKLAAGAAALAVAGAIIFLVKKNSHKSLGSARPRALLSGTKKRKSPRKKVTFQGLR